MKNNILLSLSLSLILTACSSKPSSFLPENITCKITVPTKSVEVFRKNGRRIFENMCEIEQGKRCDEEYVDEVEKFALQTNLTVTDLIYLKKIQKNQCN